MKEKEKKRSKWMIPLFFAAGIIAGMLSCTETNNSQKGVLINGVRWATCNVAAPGTFAASPEDPGMFYQWNDKTGWKPSRKLESWKSSWNGNEATTWEKANDPCPAGWRMPTKDELESLNAAGSVWTIVNGMSGRLFGSGDSAIFLPAAGFRYSDNKGSHTNAGIAGFYWSGTEDGEGSYNLYFDSVNSGPGLGKNRAFGFSCRCVEDSLE